ncbi:MAG: hypothetical protein M1818_006055 [Claussenomyces sp. TS43310]|nr:MAG: hypothetical protein M1818_006055 [Claussenomyces sp. TS43310]
MAADQAGTPGSNADSSVNAGKPSAPKDKACPFCQQPFTSSSLGRHLDLYIKEKNPKPADGVHDVDEIRKMRGGITRRQPRSSLSRREGSTPNRISGVNGGGGGSRPSPHSETGLDKEARGSMRSPSVVRRTMDTPVNGAKAGPGAIFFNTPSWHTTGVINNIPSAPRDGESRSWDEEESRARKESGQRSVSKHLLAKTTLEQKEKMMEALDNARAAELALREVLGSIRAANERDAPHSSPFDYDPLSMDFPGLCLHCLPPPPTLNSVTSVPSPKSWSITPPDQLQYDALRAHFENAFQSWRVFSAMTPSDQRYEPNYSSQHNNEPGNPQVHSVVDELEQSVASHLHATFSHWSTLSQQSQAELWRLELSRAVGGKANRIAELTTRMEKVLQENAHLKAQVEQLSMCQQPREFQLITPSTLAIDSRASAALGDMSMKGLNTGVSVENKNEPIQAQINKAIDRWRAVVQRGRGAHTGNGMAKQKPLGRGSGREQEEGLTQKGFGAGVNGGARRMDLDADADGDADAEEEAYNDSADVQTSSSGKGRAPQAPMGIMPGSAGYRNGNGSGNGGGSGTGSHAGHDGTNGNGKGYGQDNIVNMDGIIRGPYSCGSALTGQSIVR